MGHFSTPHKLLLYNPVVILGSIRKKHPFLISNLFLLTSLDPPLLSCLKFEKPDSQNHKVEVGVVLCCYMGAMHEK